MDEEDSKILNFRKAVNEWKRNTLFPGLNNEGDDESIQRRVREAQVMFFTVMSIVNDGNTENSEDTEVNTILEPLGKSSTWSESLLDNVRHILFTDLYEYPLTFNVILIDQFKNQEEEDFPTFQ